MPTFDWSNSHWSKIGRPAASPLATNTPAIGVNADGRLEIFARATNSKLYHAWQNDPGGQWSELYALDPPGFIFAAPAVQRNKDGRLEVFFAGSNNELCHIYQIFGPGGDIQWSQTESLHLPMQGLPAVQVNEDGRLEVFVWDSANRLQHIWQKPTGGWSAWHVIKFDSPPNSNPPQVAGTPCAGRNADKRIEVFVRGTDGRLWHAWQPRVNSIAEAEAEQIFLYPMVGDIQIAGHPATKNGAGMLEVLWVDAIGKLSHVYQTSPNSGWNNAVVALGGSLQNRPAIGRAADSRLEAFVRGTDDRIYHSVQTAPGSSNWTPLESLDGSYPSAPAVETNKDGRLDIFLVNGSGELWQLQQFPRDFVGVRSGSFSLNGREFRHVGINTHELVYHTEAQAQFDLRKAQEAEIKQVRVFLPANNHDTEATIARLAWTLNQAYTRGIRLTVAMMNMYNDRIRAHDALGAINCAMGDNDDNAYTRTYGDGKILDRPWLQANVNSSETNYLKFVKAIVTRFKDDPAIFAWEVGNEISDPSATPTTVETLLQFYAKVAATIRAIDRYHLIAPGNISTAQLNLTNSSQQDRLYRDFDYVTTHIYNWVNDGKTPTVYLSRPVAERELARRLNKPFVVEEYGFDKRSYDTHFPGKDFLLEVQNFFSDLYPSSPPPSGPNPPKTADAIMVWGVEFRMPGDSEDHGSSDGEYGPGAQGRIEDYKQLWKTWAQALSASNKVLPHDIA